MFADIRRDRGQLPGRQALHAGRRPAHHRVVLQRLPRHGPAPGRARRHARGARSGRRRLGRHAQHLRHLALPRRARARARRPARQGSGAAVHVGLRRQRHHAGDAAEAAARLRHLLRREEPRLHDRRHPQRRRREAIWRNNDLADLEAKLQPVRARCAQDHRLRVRLLHGRADGADRRHLRPGAEIRRAHLSRRGARGRPLRPARRRPRRARRRHASRRHHQRHAGQGLRHHGRLHRRQRRPVRRHPLLCAGLHLHHLAGAGHRRRRGCQHPPSQGRAAPSASATRSGCAR